MKNNKKLPINYYHLTKIKTFLASNHRRIISKRYDSSNFHIHRYYKSITTNFK